MQTEMKLYLYYPLVKISQKTETSKDGYIKGYLSLAGMILEILS